VKRSKQRDGRNAVLEVEMLAEGHDVSGASLALSPATWRSSASPIEIG
jgi:hypothetical protein